MKGAIFYSSKYGSTAEYANWISEATGLPIFNMKNSKADPSQFDYLVLGSPIIYYKVWNHNWVKKNLERIENMPILYFTVSGAPDGPKLDEWISESLPDKFIRNMEHIALGGRQIPEQLSWFDRTMLVIGSWMSTDAKVSKEELHGFDFMDRASIQPIVDFVGEMNAKEVPAFQGW